MKHSHVGTTHDSGIVTIPHAYYNINTFRVNTLKILLPTVREGNVFTGVCHSVHNRPHDYLFTAHPCYGEVGTHSAGMLFFV